ncbi:MAG: methylamine utilization protein [bacterium]|nr:methylamine utilization protein [bacterium]
MNYSKPYHFFVYRLIPVAMLTSFIFACGESEAPKQGAETTPPTDSAAMREIVVSQKDKQFAPTELKIKTGDSVSFRNDDPFFHNVFSFSETRVFDLGSYPQGETRKVVFDKPGEVEVECAIHENMKLKIIVE